MPARTCWWRRGPGAEGVRGFLSNTDLFHVMVAAFGWDEASAR